MVIKIILSDFTEDYNYLKLIWINTKKEYKVFIRNCSKEYKKDSYINSEMQEWRGYGEISVGYHIQIEKSEIGNDNNICKGY